MIPLTWNQVPSDARVVGPDERLSWPRTIGIGAQHVVAMFGATFLVPVLTGFPPATTLLFSGIGTILFLIITGNRLPSYLGSSFSVIAPVLAAVGTNGTGSALGGLVAVGLTLIVIGAVVHFVGTEWLNATLPPVVTGAVVALIGFNLAPAAKQNFEKGPVVGLVTLVLLVATIAFFRGIVGRLAIFLAVVLGYLLAWALGDVDTSAISAAPWIGLPEFQTPSFTLAVLPLFLPAVIALVAENIGHVKSVGQMTDRDMDPLMGRALAADGVATTLAGFGGGSATTTYAENIGVMGATKVYSTAAYYVAAVVAILLGLCPKFGAIVSATPGGVLGGITVILYGMIGLVGAKIWVENGVDFGDPVNLVGLSAGLIAGIGGVTMTITSNFELGGIALGTILVIVYFHLVNNLGPNRTHHTTPALSHPEDGAGPGPTHRSEPDQE